MFLPYQFCNQITRKCLCEIHPGVNHIPQSLAKIFFFKTDIWKLILKLNLLLFKGQRGIRIIISHEISSDLSFNTSYTTLCQHTRGVNTPTHISIFSHTHTHVFKSYFSASIVMKFTRAFILNSPRSSHR